MTLAIAPEDDGRMPRSLAGHQRGPFLDRLDRLYAIRVHPLIRIRRAAQVAHQSSLLVALDDDGGEVSVGRLDEDHHWPCLDAEADALGADPLVPVVPVADV